MSSETNFDRRLYLLLLVGSDSKTTLENLEQIKNGFLKQFKENICYENSIFFVSDKDVQTLGKEIKNDFGNSIGYLIIDITDNLNPYDFIANITENHTHSKELVELVKTFLQKSTKEEEIKPLTLEEQLEDAIAVEDYKLAASLRDKIKENQQVI